MSRLSFKLTLLGRSLLLVICESFANTICWAVAGILFGRNRDTQPILSLALLAWTLGLRHALDADHISAIDNATRGLINLGQLPVTCGLFFSLGHSTIVVVVTVAIAISSDVFGKLQHVGDIGGIVGAAVSGSFLFIIGLANTIILWRILKQRRNLKIRQQSAVHGEAPNDINRTPEHNHMLMMRILGPIITFVNQPWKMYPVGVLFGFGFDTASSIALLALSAIAKKGPDGGSIPSAHVVILPLLFTAGMTLIDSIDSILMLYSYSGFPEHSWALFERPRKLLPGQDVGNQMNAIKSTGRVLDTAEPTPELSKQTTRSPLPNTDVPRLQPQDLGTVVTRDSVVKMNVMSGLSIILTLMSILVAFSISLITIMGLIGQQCSKCITAAEAEDGGGLAGSWWRAWARADDNSGYVGAAIVGVFVVTMAGWYGIPWIVRRVGIRKHK